MIFNVGDFEFYEKGKEFKDLMLTNGTSDKNKHALQANIIGKVCYEGKILDNLQLYN